MTPRIPAHAAVVFTEAFLALERAKSVKRAAEDQYQAANQAYREALIGLERSEHASYQRIDAS